MARRAESDRGGADQSGESNAVVDEADDRPVLVGVIALAGVSLVVGLIVALVVMGGTRVTGLAGGGGGGGGGGGPEPTMSLPAISETEYENPTLTLTPESTDGAPEGEGEAPAETETSEAEAQITLEISTTTAAPMERIDVSGVYTGGDGAVLSIQRFTDGTWNDITSNAAVAGEQFSTFIALGRPGENQIRAYDAAADLASNEVAVVIE